MKLFYFFLLLLGFNFFVNAEQQEQWKLNIFDKNNNLSVVAMIILTESPTSTCLDGEWFDVDVKEAKKYRKLSFQLNRNCLIGSIMRLWYSDATIGVIHMPSSLVRFQKIHFQANILHSVWGGLRV